MGASAWERAAAGVRRRHAELISRGWGHLMRASAFTHLWSSLVWWCALAAFGLGCILTPPQARLHRRPSASLHGTSTEQAAELRLRLN